MGDLLGHYLKQPVMTVYEPPAVQRIPRETIFRAIYRQLTPATWLSLAALVGAAVPMFRLFKMIVGQAP